VSRVALLLGVLLAAAGGGPRTAVAQPPTLPPVSYVCPMAGDEDVTEDKAGKCPKCEMELEGIRLDSVWTCRIHAAVIREQSGKCRIDGRALLQMTMGLSFVCGGRPRNR
jgi:hypothetical protein